MEIIKNCVVVLLFGVLLVSMMFFGVTMIEAKSEKKDEAIEVYSEQLFVNQI